jgi:hypothetical protein
MARPIFFLITLFLNIGTGNEPVRFSPTTPLRAAQTLPAGTAAERGAWIARQAEDRDMGKDGRTVMRMRLFDRQGRPRERALIVTSITGGAGRPVPTDRTLIRFTEPADIRGTSFLVWDQPSGDDERFLYLPSLGRVRRIAGSEAQESFVGSDLTYEDIGGREFEAYTYRLLDASATWTAADGSRHPAYLLESRRKDTGARFPRAESLVRQDNFVVVGARIFNRRDELQKTFAVTRLERTGAYWTAMAMTMTDVSARTRTDLVIEDVRYDIGLGADDFTRRELERPLAAGARQPAGTAR